MGAGLTGFVNSLDRRKEVWVLWPEHLDDMILSVSGELVTRGSLGHSVCVLYHAPEQRHTSSCLLERRLYSYWHRFHSFFLKDFLITHVSVCMFM